jgi:alkaline phosphatase D
MRFLILYLIANISFAEIVYKLGIGSCVDQDYPTPAWASLEKESINSFFFLGDNIYGDVPSGRLDNVILSYEKLNDQMPSWLKNTEKLVIWDDHDYGLNDAGANYIYKAESQQIYNDAWNIDQNDPRRSREGIYFSELKDIAGKKILIVGLDTRYFRSNLIKIGNSYKPHKNSNTTILGPIQWQWLEKELSREHDILILASSIQVLATEHRFEKWSNIPHERDKLLALLNKLSSKVLIISGDRHRSGFYKLDNIYEFTSSSLNKGIFPSYESDSLLLGKTYTQNNYGIVQLHENSLNLFIKDENMNILESLEIPLK